MCTVKVTSIAINPAIPEECSVAFAEFSVLQPMEMPRSQQEDFSRTYAFKDHLKLAEWHAELAVHSRHHSSSGDTILINRWRRQTLIVKI